MSDDPLGLFAVARDDLDEYPDELTLPNRLVAPDESFETGGVPPRGEGGVCLDMTDSISYHLSMDDRSANLVTALVVALADALEETTRRVGAHGATGASALATILFNPGERIDQLSLVLGITGSGTVRLVDRLAADGLVERRPGQDKRSVSLWLTERGKAVAEAIVAERRAVLRWALEPLTDAQRRTLAAVAEPVLAGMAVDREHADRICRLCDYLVCPQDRCPVEQSVS